ncbi:Hypothetical predicted protein [Cloeon dipterum]|uniref:histone acetyltransferase n=1 Tax=Cloeon dipterum TaxID=197152 RepID=A0A8S1DHS7_9INSE|nr:Hypothetical predicted protein [Cloeon dipterum]
MVGHSVWPLMVTADAQEVKTSDQGVAEKISNALDCGFKVIACIGESKQDREAAQRELLLYGQASVLTARVSKWTNLVLAYEPVWATETGEVPDPKEVIDVLTRLRLWISLAKSQEVGDSLRIIYAGNLTTDLLNGLRNNTDGFLFKSEPLLFCSIGSQRIGSGEVKKGKDPATKVEIKRKLYALPGGRTNKTSKKLITLDDISLAHLFSYFLKFAVRLEASRTKSKGQQPDKPILTNEGNLRSATHSRRFNFVYQDDCEEEETDEDDEDERDISSSPEEPQLPKYDPRLDELLKLRAQQRLDLLLHISTQCQRKESTDCIVPLCSEMKYVWSHMQRCDEAECPIPLCDRLADIISHWTTCYVEEDRECPLCTPVKERQTRKNLKARRRLPQRQQPPSSNAVPILDPPSPSSTIYSSPKQAAEEENESHAGETACCNSGTGVKTCDEKIEVKEMPVTVRKKHKGKSKKRPQGFNRKQGKKSGRKSAGRGQKSNQKRAQTPEEEDDEDDEDIESDGEEQSKLKEAEQEEPQPKSPSPPAPAQVGALSFAEANSKEPELLPQALTPTRPKNDMQARRQAKSKVWTLSDGSDVEESPEEELAAISVAINNVKRLVYTLFLIRTTVRCKGNKGAQLDVEDCCKNVTCQPMQDVLNHLRICRKGEDCLVACCYSARQVICGWEFCQEYCSVCSTVRCIWKDIDKVPAPVFSDCHIPDEDLLSLMTGDLSVSLHKQYAHLAQKQLSSKRSLHVMHYAGILQRRQQHLHDKQQQAEDEHTLKLHDLHAYDCIMQLNMQQKLELLLHVHECTTPHLCEVELCREMKTLWTHVCDCTNVKCAAVCITIRELSLHWNMCCNNISECPLCTPLAQARFEQQQEACSASSVDSSTKEHEMRSLIRKMRTLLAVFLCISEEKEDDVSYRKLYGSCCAVSIVYLVFFFLSSSTSELK